MDKQRLNNKLANLRNKLEKTGKKALLTAALAAPVITMGSCSRSTPERLNPHTMVQAAVLDNDDRKFEDLKFEDALFDLGKEEALGKIKEKIDNHFNEKEEIAELIYDNVKAQQNKKAENIQDPIHTPAMDTQLDKRKICTESGKYDISVETPQGASGLRGRALRAARQKQCHRGVAVSYYQGRD